MLYASFHSMQLSETEYLSFLNKFPVFLLSFSGVKKTSCVDSLYLYHELFSYVHDLHTGTCYFMKT